MRTLPKAKRTEAFTPAEAAICRALLNRADVGLDAAELRASILKHPRFRPTTKKLAIAELANALRRLEADGVLRDRHGAFRLTRKGRLVAALIVTATNPLPLRRSQAAAALRKSA